MLMNLWMVSYMVLGHGLQGTSPNSSSIQYKGRTCYSNKDKCGAYYEADQNKCCQVLDDMHPDVALNPQCVPGYEVVFTHVDCASNPGWISPYGGEYYCCEELQCEEDASKCLYDGGRGKAWGECCSPSSMSPEFNGIDWKGCKDGYDMQWRFDVNAARLASEGGCSSLGEDKLQVKYKCCAAPRSTTSSTTTTNTIPRSLSGL